MTRRTAKGLLNDPDEVVAQLVEGLLLQDSALARLEGLNVVLRRDAAALRDTQVALLSGGGSGHEPAHAGYVGAGMLTGAVLGDVFASPSADAVLAAIRAVTGRAGCLLIVKNYTGDRLNFGLAAERAKTEYGLEVELVIVGDDVALPRAAQPRGVAGTVFVHKVAGAAAAAGESLASVRAQAEAAAAATVSLGVALSTCTLPGQPVDTRLADDEIELGLGIHGEPGVETLPLTPVDAIVDEMVSRLEGDARFQAGLAAASHGLALLVNNLGGATPMELALVARRAVAARGTPVTQLYSGTFLSALDMKGVSLSLLPLDRARSAQLAAPTQAPAWRLASTPGDGGGGARTLPTPAQHIAETRRPTTLTDTGRQLEAAITAACAALIGAETDLNDLDRRVGDGDCGTTLRRGAERLKQDLDAHYPLNDAAATLQALGTSLAQATGGSTGVLYAIFFEAAARALRASGGWTGALCAGTEAVSSYGGARRGDRTMLDALLPAAEAAEDAYRGGEDVHEVLNAAATAAETGAEHTQTLGRAQAGRSAYLGQDVLIGTADPGARAVALWLRAVARAYAQL